VSRTGEHDGGRLPTGDDEEAVRRVLVLRPGAIGDTLVALPALLALRRRFPDALIEAVGNATALPIAESSGLVDRWIGFDDGRVTRLFMPGAPGPDDHFLGLDVAVAWGRDADGTLRAGLDRRGARSVVVAPSRPDPGAPELVARYLLRTLAPLGIAVGGDGTLDLPELRVPAEADDLAQAELAAAGLAGRPFVAVHPGSGSPAKNWPAERYAALLDLLAGQHGLAAIVLGGPADASALLVLHDQASSVPSPIVDRPLLVVAALLRRAAAFVGNDSGLAHLAGLLGLPTLALFGPSDPTLWTPLGPRVRLVRSAALDALPADAVLGELRSLLDAASQRSSA
jgi:ADP-heptose:LPS heptosyltransferase